MIWPIGYADWQGDLGELSREAGAVLSALAPRPGLEGANERLIRHYLNVGALTRPPVQGRRLAFGARQLAELLAVRVLLADGWPLTRIAETVPVLEFDALVGIVVPPRPSAPEAPAEPAAAAAPPASRAQELVARFQAQAGGAPAGWSGTSKAADPMVASALVRSATPEYGYAERRTARDLDEAAAKIGRAQLGMAESGPVVRRVLEISPAPWMRVSMEEAALDGLTPKEASDAVRALKTYLEDHLSKRSRA